MELRDHDNKKNGSIRKEKYEGTEEEMMAYLEQQPLNENSKEIGREDISCGLFGWHPKWLQRLASKKAYIVIYSLLGMNQFIISTYFSMTISTIEKRFKLPSTATGTVSSAWDFGDLLALMVTAYVGNSGNKAKWVAATSLLAAISCYMRYIPHYIYGSGIDPMIYNVSSNISSQDAMCLGGSLNENCFLNSEGLVSFVILLSANFVIGLGASAYYTLGAAYLDDNVMKNEFPLLFGVVVFVKYIGPLIGLLMAKYTLNLYVDPNVTPPFDQKDPRWIGAWYLGWIPLGSSHIALSLLIGFFPKVLPKVMKRRIESGLPLNPELKKRTLKDFKSTIVRLLKNPVLVLNTVSSTFYVIGLMGYWIFMPKYVETQFRTTAAESGFTTGSVWVICTAVGIFLSGTLISKFKPRARYLAAWNVFTETVEVLGHVGFAFLGCHKEDLAGSLNLDGTWNLTQDCNRNCGCTNQISYSPICSNDQQTTFYSPCHAGCLDFGIINGTKTYLNCSCIGGSEMATSGACPVDCGNDYLIFLVMIGVMKFLTATGRAGNTIIQFRAVAPEDKAVSIAMAEMTICALALIPSPIGYGIIMDYSCLIWGETCGETGNCWLYDGHLLRILLNFTSVGFIFIATLFDIGVVYKVKSLEIYDKETEIDGNVTTTEESKGQTVN